MGLFGFGKKKKEDLPPPPAAGAVPPPPPSLSEEKPLENIPLPPESTSFDLPEEELDVLAETPEDMPSLETYQTGPQMSDDLDVPRETEPLPSLDLPEFPDMPVEDVPEELPELEAAEEELTEVPEITIYEEEPLELPTEPMIATGGELYLQMTTFESLVTSIDDIKVSVDSAGRHTANLADIQEKTHKEEEKWRRSLDSIQKKMLFLDSMLFER